MTAYYQPQLPLETIPAAWVPSDDNGLKVLIDPEQELTALAADWTGTGPRCTRQHKNTQCANPIFGGHIVWEMREGHICATHAAFIHFIKGRCPECANT